MRAAVLVQGLRRTFRGTRERRGLRGRWWLGARAEVVALDGLDLAVAPGECVGLLGPNGAGKSTLLLTLAGMLKAQHGEVWVLGRRPGTTAARRLVGYAPEQPAFPAELSVGELLRYLAAAHERGAAGRRAAVERAVELGGLENWVDRRAGSLSRGMRQRLALAQAALGGRELLLLDETLSGIDPVAGREIGDRILALAEQGVAIVVSSHDLGELERLATRVAIVGRGRVIRSVAAEELLTHRSLMLVLPGGNQAAVRLLTQQFRDVVAHAAGVRVAIGPRQSPEVVLAFCRERGIPVLASRVVTRTLEEVALEALNSEVAA
jgi:ABC-type multidrug transport system ATPase subunit